MISDSKSSPDHIFSKVFQAFFVAITSLFIHDYIYRPNGLIYSLIFSSPKVAGQALTIKKTLLKFLKTVNFYGEHRKKIMLTVLVTGSIGSGKSSVITYLKSKKYPVFQADQSAKKLLKPGSPCYSGLKKLFPDSHFLFSNGEFDKKKLAFQIFTFPEKKKMMEALIHPQVQKSFKQFVADQKMKKQRVVFYEAPLISKSLFDRFDQRILLTCPQHLKIKRLLKTGWQRAEIQQRLSQQIPEANILNKVDFIIRNNKGFDHLKKETDKILFFIKSKKSSKKNLVSPKTIR